MSTKVYLDMDVLQAAQGRISFIFDKFENICVSFSAGKDSTVMLHLVMDEAKRRQRKVSVLFIDWEAQFNLTIDHCKACFDLYAEWVIPYWVCLPLKTTNACSMYEPEWTCWEVAKKPLWVRDIPEWAISDHTYFPFFYEAMSFEEFVPLFGEWVASGTPTAVLVGIRTAESLNRWRTLFSESKTCFEGHQWTTKLSNNVFNMYPIYDWKTEDIWVYHSTTGFPYNGLYDCMFQAGLSVSQMRICEPFGDEQRKGLWLYHVVEPETWAKLLSRVGGVNTGSLYAGQHKGMLGDGAIVKPEGFTWKDFAKHLLDSMPTPTAEHYKNKITVWLKWYQDHGFKGFFPVGSNDILDELPGDTGAKDTPTWRRVCKMLLKNDYWCKTLVFSPTKQSSFEKYLKLMHKRRKTWGIFDDVSE